MGFADPSLYSLASQSQSTYFNDITTGNNDFTPSGNTAGLYAATTGYDMASGLGTPKAAALVPALCQQAVRVTYPGEEYTFSTSTCASACTLRSPPARPGRSPTMPSGFRTVCTSTRPPA